MNKVLLLSDKEQLPRGAFDFACMLNQQEPLLLAGIFLPKVDYWNSIYYYSFGMGVPVPYLPPAEDELVQSAVPQFTKLCMRNMITHKVREKAYDEVKEELRRETRFADLLLFSNEAFYDHLDSVISDEYSDETYHLAECPVLIMPEQFVRPENIILAYDGSAASIRAIKQFAYLMPELAKLDTLLVYVSRHNDDIPDKAFIEELAIRHYPRLNMLKLDTDPKKGFRTWLNNRKNSVLVAGAHGRSGFSEFFKKSFIRDAVEERMMPVFITH